MPRKPTPRSSTGRGIKHRNWRHTGQRNPVERKNSAFGMGTGIKQLTETELKAPTRDNFAFCVVCGTEIMAPINLTDAIKLGSESRGS